MASTQSNMGIGGYILMGNLRTYFGIFFGGIASFASLEGVYLVYP